MWWEYGFSTELPDRSNTENVWGWFNKIKLQTSPAPSVQVRHCFPIYHTWKAATELERRIWASGKVKCRSSSTVSTKIQTFFLSNVPQVITNFWLFFRVLKKQIFFFYSICKCFHCIYKELIFWGSY